MSAQRGHDWGHSGVTIGVTIEVQAGLPEKMPPFLVPGLRLYHLGLAPSCSGLPPPPLPARHGDNPCPSIRVRITSMRPGAGPGWGLVQPHASQQWPRPALLGTSPSRPQTARGSRIPPGGLLRSPSSAVGTHHRPRAACHPPSLEHCYQHCVHCYQHCVHCYQHLLRQPSRSHPGLWLWHDADSGQVPWVRRRVTDRWA